MDNAAAPFPPSFGDISDQEIEQLADALGLTLRKIAQGLNDPAYNYMIRTAPTVSEYDGAEYLHWHISILPKLAIAAGFEWGQAYISILRHPRTQLNS